MTTTDDRIYTREELAKLFRVTSSTLGRWLREKRLPEPDIAPTRKAQQWKASTLRQAGLKV